MRAVVASKKSKQIKPHLTRKRLGREIDEKVEDWVEIWFKEKIWLNMWIAA
jgi:hypothetical protein